MVSSSLAESNVKVGGTVKVKTINGLIAEGIVISADDSKKVLVLDTKETAANKPLIRIFNTEHLKTVEAISAPLPENILHASKKMENFTKNNPVNGSKTDERLDRTIKELVPNMMKSKSVSLRGQQAYLQLRRTIADTHWSGEDIRVLGLVLVQKPYEVANVTKDAEATGFDESRAESAVLQVQKILSKPLTEYTARAPLDFIIGAVLAN